MTEHARHQVIDTNVHSPFNVTKPVFKHMLRQRSGHILKHQQHYTAIRAPPTAVHPQRQSGGLPDLARFLPTVFQPQSGNELRRLAWRFNAIGPAG